MNTLVSVAHPLFDPASLYNQLRLTVRGQYKIRGYFHWMRHRAECAQKEGRPLRPAQPRSEADLHQRACALEGRTEADTASSSGPEPRNGSTPAIQVTDILEATTWILLAGTPEQEGVFPLLRGAADLLLVNEEDGTRTLGLLVSLPQEVNERLVREARPWGCRAFVFEPEVLPRLAGFVGMAGEVSAERILHQGFQRDLLVDNIEVARISAAVPDLVGEYHGVSTVCFRRRPHSIPPGSDPFPPRGEPPHVVVVFHPAQEEGTSANALP